MNNQRKHADITVVVTRSYESLDLIKDCVNSLAAQSDRSVHVLFLDQKVSDETEEYIKNVYSRNTTFIYIRIPAKSLSFARNYGLSHADTNLIAFCDVDCILNQNWASEIVNTFNEERAAIVGTKILPEWHGKISWIHSSKVIQEFYSLLDISKSRIEIPKIIGASFAVDKESLGKICYFDENLGRKDGNFLGGEETDLCQRALKAKKRVVYTPYTFAKHQIPSMRLSWKWLLNRAYSGGISRAKRGGKAQPFNQQYGIKDRFAIVSILPFYSLGYLKGKVQRGI